MNSKIYSTVYFLLFCFLLTNSQTNKLAFTQNKGQWDPSISYKTDFPCGQALATSTGMLIGLFDTISLAERTEWGNKMEERGTGAQYLVEHPQPPALKGHGWRFHFLNGNSAMSMESKNKLSGFCNYWVGDESVQSSKVYSYEEITYRNVYQDIDVKYYTSPLGFLENDIIIKPYADASNLELEIEGIDEISQNSNGDLILSTSVGDVVVPSPVSYLIDEAGLKTEIIVSYILEHNSNGQTIRFSIPNYDNSKTLVIDPIVVRWATFASNNTSSDSHNHCTAIDSLGNLYLTGRINSTGLITVGAFQSTVGGGADVFVGKYTEATTPGGAGSRIWQTYLGGTGQENAIGIQMGIGGYIYLCVNTSSDIAKTYGSGFSAGSWTQRTSGGGTRQQALIIKMDLAGNGAMTRELGTVTSNYSTQCSDLRILKTGTSTYDIIYTGYISQPASSGSADGDFPQPQTPAGSNYTQPASIKLNGIVVRMTNDLATLTWIKNIGSDVSTAADDAILISTVDAAGDIFVAGYTKGTANISYNNPSSQTTRGGNQDGWIMKLNGSGVVQWSRYFNANAVSICSILSMELNKADSNLIIAGTTNGLGSANITAGSVQTTYGGSTDLFVAKISKSGIATIWGTYMGGSGTETNMMGLSTDLNDDIYFLGYSASTNYPTTSNPLQAVNYGGNDAVFTKLNSSGTTIMYSTYYGGSNDDNDPIGQRGILFYNCRIYLSLTACSADIPLTEGTLTSSKTSGTTIPEPIIVSIANPPDLSNNTISSAQTVSCGQTPSTLTAGVASYNIAYIIRNNSTQTNGTTGAYPSGVPTPGAAYQWQKSIDYRYSWTDIVGATSQNYSPGVITQTTFYRRIVSGDYCASTDSNICVYVSGGPSVSPTATCAATTLSLFANPSGGGGSNTFSWTGPLSFTSSSENPQIFSATNAVNGNYTVTVTDVNGCQNTRVVYIDFNSCTYSVVLSVSLTNFDATKQETSSKITWNTSNERYSDFFDVERSIDGKSWLKIGTVEAAGTSNKTRSYELLDRNPLDGINYYRLKIVDIAAHFKYSSIKTVNFDKLSTINIVNASPNPFRNQLNLNYSSSGSGKVTAKITDAVGNVLAVKETEANKGENNLELNTADISSGIYFITLIQEGIFSNCKMMVKN